MPGGGGARIGGGRKPQPASLAALRGNPSRRPIKPGIQAGAFTAPAPSWLGLTGQAWWQEHRDMYSRLGLLTELTGGAYALLADSWGRWIDLRRDPDASETAIHNAFSRLYRLIAEFGAGPASLTRITATAGAGETDPVEAYRAARKSA